MNFVVFDTETTSLERPFCYNIGYIIANDKGETVLKKDFVVEQIWHNLPLFSTAYYANKRPLYVESMRAHRTVMDKFGYICQEMIRDFKALNVECAYAYNSSFDEKVFNFNCDWFKCINPFDDIPVYDIRGNFCFVYGENEDYKKFCEEHGYFTESGCYSSTAEIAYRFLTKNTDFIEEHTALHDSEIELVILLNSLVWTWINKEYKAPKSLGGPTIEKELHIRTAEQTDYYFKYEKIRINKDKTEITLK